MWVQGLCTKRSSIPFKLIGYSSDEIEIIMRLLMTLCLMAFKDLEETCLCRQYNIGPPTSCY